MNREQAMAEALARHGQVAQGGAVVAAAGVAVAVRIDGSAVQAEARALRLIWPSEKVHAVPWRALRVGERPAKKELGGQFRAGRLL